MANKDLEVIVGLDIPKSVSEIENDLKAIKKLLDRSDGGKLKISAGLNMGLTIGNINSQIKQIQKSINTIKITPQLDTNSVNQAGKQTSTQLTNQINNAVKNIDFTAIARNLRKAFNINDNASIKEATENIKAMYEAFNTDPEKYKAAFDRLIGWYEQRSNDLIYTEKQKVEELNGLLQELYNQPDVFTKLPGAGKHTKSDPLFVTKKTLEEMKSLLGSMQEVYKLFGVVRVDDKHGALIGSFFEDWHPKEYNDGLAACIQYLQKIQELRNTKRRSLFDIDSKENINTFIDSIEQTILKQLNLVDANNKIIRSNQQVAQSERDVAQAQQEVNNTRTVSANGSNDLLKQKGELANQVVSSELKILGLEQQLQTQEQKLVNLRAKEAEIFPFGEEAEQLNKQIQEAQNRYNATKQMLDNENSTHTALNEQLNAILGQIEQEKQRLNQSTQNMGSASEAGVGTSSEYLSSNISKITSVTNSAKEAEQSFKNLLASMGDTKGTVVSKEFADAAGKVNSFTVAVKSGTGAFETFKYSIDGENGGFKLDNITAANAGIQRLTESTQKYQATLKAQADILNANANALKSQWEDSNGGKSVRNEEHVAKLTEKYNVLIATIKKLRSADSITATEIKGNIKAQETDIKSLISAYHNAEKVATSLRARDTETSIINTKNNIREFMSNLNASKVSFTAVEDELQKLAQVMQALDGAASGDKAARLREVLNAFENLQTKFKAENTIAKNFDQVSNSVKKVISDLDDMSRRQIFNTHSNDAGVIEFQGKIKGLSDTAKQVKVDLDALGDSKAIPPELNARVEDLKNKFDELNGSNKTLQSNLRQNDGWARAERQIQTLTARVKEYMATNTKAAKKYSGQFDGLLSGLSQAEMNKDSEAVRRLSADFQILKSQIKAAGDQGKTLGQMIVDNAKKFSMWFSLTSNIMRAWRTLKQMVTTVKELDTAMTALKRVTDETESSYANFLKSVQTRAVELHATMTDLIDQITTWSKLGYGLNEAQNLAQVSMMYSKVGDVDNETAVKDLVATMKAYNMTAEDSIRIVDMLDVLNNRYAVSAKDLGAGLSKVASAMAVSNTSLEKSLSLITGGAEITQDAESVATALKVINARIRGKFMPLKQLYRLKSRSGQDRGKICSVSFSYAG